MDVDLRDQRIRELEDQLSASHRVIADLGKANAELMGNSTEAVRKYLTAADSLQRERVRVSRPPQPATSGPRAIPARRTPEEMAQRRTALDVEKEFKA